MKKERNMYLDVLKATSIILVVVGHCIQYGSGGKYFSENLFFDNPVFIFIYSFHMPLFMLISGYLFAYSIKTKTWTELLFIKFKQLIIPLFGWSFVSLLIELFKTPMGASTEPITISWIMKEFISSFLLGPWFLWAIWWCSFIVIIVRTFFKDNPFVYILGCLLTFVVPDSLNLSLYKFMLPFFLLAYAFNAYDYKNKLKKIYLHKAFILCCFITFAILLTLFNDNSYIYVSGYCILNKNIIQQIYNNVFRFIIGIMGSTSIMYLIYSLVNILPDKANYLLTYIGKNTLGIYIISSYMFVEILSKVSFSLKGINYFYILIEFICILSVSILINAILKKTKITNILFLGGR